MNATRWAIAGGATSLVLASYFVFEGQEQALDELVGTWGSQRVAQLGAVLPQAVAGLEGLIILFASRGTRFFRAVSMGICLAAILLVVHSIPSELWNSPHAVGAAPRDALIEWLSEPKSLLQTAVPIWLAGLAVANALWGGRASSCKTPRRVRGRRAIYGESEWMTLARAKELFPSRGGIVIGEAHRIDQEAVANTRFRITDPASWGNAGKRPLLCFDGSFGSSHGLVFAGSGGFKTTSVTIPTALRWAGGIVLLDPSREVASIVGEHRRRMGRTVILLDPSNPMMGFNVLDWIGRFGASEEEDIVAVANWLMSDTAQQGSLRDDFFRASALQLITALIADVCLSGHTPPVQQHLRQMRINLSEPEPKLRQRLQLIHDNSASPFVRENVAPFIAMTPETFSGVYANAIKETHWLSYPNYAGLVSGNYFTTDELASGKIDILINIDLKTLDAHPGLARTILGALLNALYCRNGDVAGRTLFLLDEVARLGYLRILETARDAGRKYGISLLMLFQSIGQMRETYGGIDAASKWFESASWISFAAVNDPDTADYISRRCGTTTVEVGQLSQSTQSSGSSRTRSKQLAARALIQPDEVLRMRADEQIVFTSGNPPLRCGRAIWFRRKDLRGLVSAQHTAQR